MLFLTSFHKNTISFHGKMHSYRIVGKKELSLFVSSPINARSTQNVPDGSWNALKYLKNKIHMFHNVPYSIPVKILSRHPFRVQIEFCGLKLEGTESYGHGLMNHHLLYEIRHVFNDSKNKLEEQDYQVILKHTKKSVVLETEKIALICEDAIKLEQLSILLIAIIHNNRRYSLLIQLIPLYFLIILLIIAVIK